MKILRGFCISPGYVPITHILLRDLIPDSYFTTTICFVATKDPATRR